MENLIILDQREEEYLMRSLETALKVRKLQHLFLWTQGQFQGLLPHETMVCIQFSENNEVQKIECLHSKVHDEALIHFLCNSNDGLALRIAQYCRANLLLPCVIEQGQRDFLNPLSLFQQEIERYELGNAVVHGTERMCCKGTFFALFGHPQPPTHRQEYFLDLLLPSLHLAFLRVIAAGEEAIDSAVDSPSLLSEREIEVLRWVSQGKSNYEIGMILELSTLTVKNHMQKIYRKLNVHNRAQAVSHFHAQFPNLQDSKHKNSEIASSEELG